MVKTNNLENVLMATISRNRHKSPKYNPLPYIKMMYNIQSGYCVTYDWRRCHKTRKAQPTSHAQAATPIKMVPSDVGETYKLMPN